MKTKRNLLISSSLIVAIATTIAAVAHVFVPKANDENEIIKEDIDFLHERVDFLLSQEKYDDYAIEDAYLEEYVDGLLLNEEGIWEYEQSVYYQDNELEVEVIDISTPGVEIDTSIGTIENKMFVIEDTSGFGVPWFWLTNNQDLYLNNVIIISNRQYGGSQGIDTMIKPKGDISGENVLVSSRVAYDPYDDVSIDLYASNFNLLTNTGNWNLKIDLSYSIDIGAGGYLFYEEYTKQDNLEITRGYVK